MRSILVKDFKHETEAYLWEESGDGSLDRMEFVDKNWWEHVRLSNGNPRSFCGTPNDILFIFDTPKERLEYETVLKKQLAERRGNR